MNEDKKTLVIIIWMLILTILPSVSAHSQERILEYDSRIIIHQDATLTVTETITVVCERDRIKHGIFRTFPISYKDKYGNRFRVRFEVLSVKRDEQNENYEIKNDLNNIKIYIGQESVFLKKGTYTYQITYRTGRQLGFFDDFDELYWNVTGNDWEFAIEKVRATIELPSGALMNNFAGYTGFQGEAGMDFSFQENKQGQLVFTSTRAFEPNQGMTFAVSWPKGFVTPPTREEQINDFLEDNGSVLAALFGFMLVFLYYLFNWLRVGKDPQKGPIYPIFQAPENISPAAARYILKMGYNDRVFTAAILNMAVNGYLKINEDNGKFELIKTGENESKLTRGERKVAGKLFPGSSLKIELKTKNHRKISKAILALKNDLKLNFEKQNFVLNRKYFIWGAIISGLTLLGIAFWTPQKMPAFFILVWLSGWSAGTFTLLYRVIQVWRGTLASQGSQKAVSMFGALFLTAFSLPFVGGEIFGIFMFGSFFTPVTTLIILAIVLTNLLFFHLLKAPTIHGRKIMDRIEGLKMYLEISEKDRMTVWKVPKLTPQLFEKLLPYAVALGVESEWSNKLANALEGMSTQRGYRPRWYSGTAWHSLSIIDFSSQIGHSFTSAVSASSSAPGSGSGSSGGGSSGGGGGGGGGGGW